MWFKKEKIERISKDLRKYNGRLQVADTFYKGVWIEFEEKIIEICRITVKLPTKMNINIIKREIAELDMPQKYRQMLFDKCKMLLNTFEEDNRRHNRRIKKIEELLT